jgi:acyl carrier protein
LREELVTIVLDCLRELGRQESLELAAELGPDTRLFGEGGALDSVGLVSLAVAVEQAVEERYGRPVSLADEKALSQARSPYRTVGTLADYAEKVLGAGA